VISIALVMSILVVAAFLVLLYKLPVRIRRFLSRRYISLDIILCLMIFWALGFTIIGIIAAAFISLFVSVYLLWYKISGEKRDERIIKDRAAKRHAGRLVIITAKIYNRFKSPKEASA